MKNIFKICSCTPTPEVVDVQAPKCGLSPVRGLTRYQRVWGMRETNDFKANSNIINNMFSNIFAYTPIDSWDALLTIIYHLGNIKNQNFFSGRGIISQRQGGVQWHRLDQNGHILHAGMGVLRCQLK